MKSAAGNLILPVKPLFATKWKESSKNQHAFSEEVEGSCEEHWVCTYVHKNLKHWRVSFTDSQGCCLCLAEVRLGYSRALFVAEIQSNGIGFHWVLRRWLNDFYQIYIWTWLPTPVLLVRHLYNPVNREPTKHGQFTNL